MSASPRFSTPSRTRALRRTTTRSAPSTRTSASCPCRTSGWSGCATSTIPRSSPPPSLSSSTSRAWSRARRRARASATNSLSNIRGCDAIVHVVRCFDDPNVTHVEGSTDPLRDIDIINTELIMADLEMIDRRIDKAQKDGQGRRQALQPRGRSCSRRCATI